MLALETPRLVLRPYRPDDWQEVHRYASIPEFSQYDVWGPNSVEDTKRFVADRILVSLRSRLGPFLRRLMRSDASVEQRAANALS